MVVQHIYWHGDTNHSKVEIQGDFTAWKNVAMQQIGEQESEDGATHVFKKLITPSLVAFKFIIDGQPSLSEHYETQDGKNILDLSKSPTGIYFKKPSLAKNKLNTENIQT